MVSSWAMVILVMKIEGKLHDSKDCVREHSRCLTHSINIYWVNIWLNTFNWPTYKSTSHFSCQFISFIIESIYNRVDYAYGPWVVSSEELRILFSVKCGVGYFRELWGFSYNLCTLNKCLKIFSLSYCFSNFGCFIYSLSFFKKNRNTAGHMSVSIAFHRPWLKRVMVSLNQ